MNIGLVKHATKDVPIIINGFIHDMTTGIWIGCLIVMQATLSKLNELQTEMLRQLAGGLLKDLWTLSLVSFTVMVITGAGRVFTLKYYGWTGDIARGRKRLLVVKHVILGIIVIIGLIMQIQLYLEMQI